MVELSTALQIALSMVAFIGGWFMNVLFDRIKGLEKADTDMAKAFNDLRVELPTNYVPRSDHKEALDNIFSAIRGIKDEMKDGLQRIEDRLEREVSRT